MSMLLDKIWFTIFDELKIKLFDLHRSLLKFFAICVKTKGQRASKMLSVPTKLMIAVILNPILR